METTDGMEENNKMRQGGDAGVSSMHGISEDFFYGFKCCFSLETMGMSN